MVVEDGLLGFASRDHPGSAPAALVFARSLVRPLAVCLLPLAIVILVRMLQGMDVLSFVYAGLPAACAAAIFWTRYQLGRAVAEIRVGEGTAAVRTVWEVADGSPPHEEPVIDVRNYRSWLLVTVGAQVLELERSDWPEYDRLRETLQAAHAWHRLHG